MANGTGNGGLLGEFAVTGRFDGGNPQRSSDIVKVDEATFDVFPYSEDGDDNYMFRADVRVCSSHREPRPVTLRFEWRAWRAERYMDLRDTFFCRHEEGEWKLVRGRVEGNVTTLTLVIPPGETEVSMNAGYNYERLQTYVRSLRGNPDASARIIGFSEESRNIWCLTLTDGNVPDGGKRKLMAIGRVHPYETASSYCIEAMVNYLLGGDPRAKELMSKFVFHFIPMPNPDGVYNGLCKLTKENGLDFSHGNILASKDKAGKTLLSFARVAKPDYVLDVHSLMDREYDQVGSSDERLLGRFMNLMPDQADVGRRWTILKQRGREALGPKEKRTDYGFTSFCVEELGATKFVLGFSWFGRSFDKMEKTAIKALNALASAIMGVG